MLYNDLEKGVYIIHENPEWIPPFAKAFARAGVEFKEILLTQGALDLSAPPPQGVFWSRLSASSHTRDNATSKDYGRALLLWLESYGRKVINGSSVLELEVSKVRQALLLDAHFKARGECYKTPRTFAVFGKDSLPEVARQFQGAFITKHNQGGKGLGVRLFENIEEFRTYVNSREFELPIDGITLLQEYVESKQSFITRAEFIGGRFHYAVRVDTSSGGFELCPADACVVGADSAGAGTEASRLDSSSTRESHTKSSPLESHALDSRGKSQAESRTDSPPARPALAGAACAVGAGDKFSLRSDINADSPLIRSLEAFLERHNVLVAGIEFIESVEGDVVVYDINTNTNYNSTLESKLRASGGVGAADRLVGFLSRELAGLEGRQG